MNDDLTQIEQRVTALEGLLKGESLSQSVLNKSAVFNGQFHILNRTTLPSVCDIGDLTVKNGALYICSAVNTWSAIGITERVQSVTNASTVTPDADSNDCVDITALAQAVTIAAPTGTPSNFQRLVIRFKDNGTARGITWNAAFTAGGTALPTTTVLSKIMNVAFRYNTANSLNKWQCLAVSQEA